MTPSGDLPANSTAVTPRGNRISATPSRFTNADGGATPVVNRWSQLTPTNAMNASKFNMATNFSSVKPQMMPPS